MIICGELTWRIESVFFCNLCGELCGHGCGFQIVHFYRDQERNTEQALISPVFHVNTASL